MNSADQPLPPAAARLPFAELCAALAAAQVLLAGYTFGAGNQSIQIPFLKRLMDGALFPRDALFDTLADYPTMFFALLARVIPSVEAIPSYYAALHLVTAFLVLLSASALARALSPRPAAGLLMALCLVGGQHAGIAEAGLYARGFTHTWAALPAALAVLALSARGQYVAALGLAGLLVNLHALLGFYAGAFAGAALLSELNRRTLDRACLAGVLFAGGAGPTVCRMVASAAVFDADWLLELRARSAHHVFLSAWWSPGRTALPLFVALCALGVLALAAHPPASGVRRRVWAMVGAGAALCAVGYVGSALVPVPFVLRAQLFRATQLLAALMLAGSAAAAAEMLDGGRPDGQSAAGRLRAVERGLAVAVVLAVCIPGLQFAIPALLLPVAALWTARGRLPWWAAVCGGAGMLLCVVAWRQIGFRPWPALTSCDLQPILRAPPLAWAAIAVALAGAFVCLRTSRTWARAAVRATLLAVCALGAVAVGGRAGEAGAVADSWVAVQAAARQLTPCDATILTPAEPGGFRVHSERSVYGEWRDGTQQFFSPAFSHVWWDRMRALQPGLTMDADGRVLNRGAALADLTAPEIAGIAEAAAARFVVLPADAEALRRLPVVYTNADWALAGATPAPEVQSAAAAAAGGTQSVIRAAGERFMRDVVDPNIRRYRQAEVVVSVVAADGRPLKRAAYVIRQTRQAFGFGCSLDNFVTPPAQSRDFKAPLVDPEQLARFKEVFNYSIIAYAGKWDAIEPVEGSPQFENLDRYVAWCATNGIGLQYHFVSGYPPNWMKWKSAAQRQALFLAHAQRLVARYGDRIGEWQVVNEKHLLAEAPEVIRWFRSARPDLKLGLADCARFFAGRDAVDMPDAETNLLRGMREVRWLRDQGAGVDFFGFHGHRPFGLWADPAAMYKAFDDCARDGVRLWVTEFGAPSEGPLTGQVRSGQWTPALQAEYYTRFFTICFSHPAVDGVNLWGIGPRTWIRHAALLDDTFQPKPAYHALKHLVRGKWMTRLAGRLPLDGRVAFRGFCGTYEIEVTPTDGAAASLGCFNVQTGQTQTVQWVWRPGTNALERAAAQ